MPRARDLDEAHRFLDPRPLDFRDEVAPALRAASDPEFYTDLPRKDAGPRKLPGAIDVIRRRLLVGASGTKMFLSGHVGSGKSTELRRLSVDPKLTNQFCVVMLQFEEHEWATLDSSQILFRIAGTLFELGSKRALLSAQARWRTVLKELDDRLGEATGMRVREASAGLEVNLLLVKFRQEVKLNEQFRKQFRAFGETQQTLLQDFLRALVDDIEEQLAKKQEPAKLLLLVDDLDKVRGPDAQNDIFNTNLNVLFEPPLSAVYTVPSAVYFGDSRADVRQSLEYLYPLRILSKAPDHFEPERAVIEDRVPFFEQLVSHRVADGLIDRDAIRLAAIYSGGVLRDFLRLLREAIDIADFNGLGVVDGVTMRSALKDARLSESAGLYDPDFAALAHIHATHTLKEGSDRRLLDLSRALECYNDAVWFEANPLLWSLLEPHAPRPRTAP